MSLSGASANMFCLVKSLVDIYLVSCLVFFLNSSLFWTRGLLRQKNPKLPDFQGMQTSWIFKHVFFPQNFSSRAVQSTHFSTFEKRRLYHTQVFTEVLNVWKSWVATCLMGADLTVVSPRDNFRTLSNICNRDFC